jgi:hypothetical protein
MTLETSQVLDGARLAPLSTSERLTAPANVEPAA